MEFTNASFSKRLIALIIDALFLGSIIKFVYTISPILASIVSLAYFICLDASHYQGTLGKQLMGLKIIDSKDVKISYPVALIRHLLKMISVICLGIGYLPLLIGKKNEKRAFCDMLTNTRVVFLTRGSK